jgi:hypothetical protein
MLAILWERLTSRFSAISVLVVVIYFFVSSLLYVWVGESNAPYWQLGSVAFTPITAGFIMLLAAGLVILVLLAAGCVCAGAFAVLESKWGSLMCAALILAVAYVVVHLEAVAESVQHLSGGKVQVGLARTRNMWFGKGLRPVMFDAYWSSGRLHYRVKYKICPEDYERALARLSVNSGGRKLGMVFRLENRFGEQLIRLEIFAAEFQRDQGDAAFIVASGSVTVTRSDYVEVINATCAGRSLNWNYLSD